MRPFAIIIRKRNGLWLAEALYAINGGPTRVVHCWQRTRTEAVNEISWHLE